MATPLPQELISTIKKENNFLICAHTQPDGDAVGSTLALSFALQELGKNVIAYNEDGLPTWLSFLKAPRTVLKADDPFPFEPTCIIALDCGDPKRLGERVFNLLKEKESINIDHHIGNPDYGTLANWVDSSSAATGEMVATLIDALDISYSTEIAEALYVSLSSDTGNFSFGNTQKSTIDLFARLISTPINIADLRVKMDNNASLEKLKLWGQLYQEIKISEQGRFAYVKVPYEYFAKFNVTQDALEGFIEQIRSIAGVRVALLLHEDIKKEKFVKVSMRSHGTDNVQAVLAPLGGGGHKNAAGGKFIGKTMDEVLELISPAVHTMW